MRMRTLKFCKESKVGVSVNLKLRLHCSNLWKKHRSNKMRCFITKTREFSHTCTAEANTPLDFNEQTLMWSLTTNILMLASCDNEVVLLAINLLWF